MCRPAAKGAVPVTGFLCCAVRLARLSRVASSRRSTTNIAASLQHWSVVACAAHIHALPPSPPCTRRPEQHPLTNEPITAPLSPQNPKLPPPMRLETNSSLYDIEIQHGVFDTSLDDVFDTLLSPSPAGSPMDAEAAANGGGGGRVWTEADKNDLDLPGSMARRNLAVRPDQSNTLAAAAAEAGGAAAAPAAHNNHGKHEQMPAPYDTIPVEGDRNIQTTPADGHSDSFEHAGGSLTVSGWGGIVTVKQGESIQVHISMICSPGVDGGQVPCV